MTLLENYSRSTRLRIDRPILFDTFFPVPEKYIVVTNSSGMSGKNWSYFNEALYFLKPSLEKAGYKVVQIGGQNEERLIHIDSDLRGQTNVNQLYYVIKNCELLLTNDSFALHIADSYSKKIVALFGLTEPGVSGGYFGDKLKQIYLTPDRTKYPASFNPGDPSVNNIPIQDVVNAITKQLNLEDSNLDKVISIGPRYSFKMIEVICNVILSPQIFSQLPPPIFRYDLFQNDQILFQNLQQIRGAILTNKEIPLPLLESIKNNIIELNIEISEQFNLEWIKAVLKLGIKKQSEHHQPVSIFTKKTNPEEVANLKYIFFDLGLYLHSLPDAKIPQSVVDEQDKEKLYYKTNRLLISNGQNFGGISQLKAGNKIKDFTDNSGKIQTDEEFFHNADHYLIYKLKS